MNHEDIKVENLGTLEREVLLSEIPHIKVTTGVEVIDLYRFGQYRNGAQEDSNREMVELVKLQANQYYPPHIHANSEARLYMVAGEGDVILNRNRYQYSPGRTELALSLLPQVLLHRGKFLALLQREEAWYPLPLAGRVLVWLQT